MPTRAMRDSTKIASFIKSAPITDFGLRDIGTEMSKSFMSAFNAYSDRQKQAAKDELDARKIGLDMQRTQQLINLDMETLPLKIQADQLKLEEARIGLGTARQEMEKNSTYLDRLKNESADTTGFGPFSERFGNPTSAQPTTGSQPQTYSTGYENGDEYLPPTTGPASSATTQSTTPTIQEIGSSSFQPATATVFGTTIDGKRDPADNQMGKYAGAKTGDPTFAGASLSAAALREHGIPISKAGEYDVIVEANGKTIQVPIADLGPADWVEERQGRTVDLTGAAARSLGLTGKDKVNYTIVKRA